jgi:hypothetical protein
VFEQVCRETDLPAGANLLTQIVAQYTGREEITPGLDLVHWDTPEWRLPYSQTYRLSLDRSVDCSSLWYVLMKIFYGLDVGSYTGAMLAKSAGKRVPWAYRRIGDIVLYDLSATKPVSHAAGIVVEPGPDGKGGFICHTTSPSNPLRFESDTYSATRRLGYGSSPFPRGWVYRALTDAQYLSLFETEAVTQPLYQHPMWYSKPLMAGADILFCQIQLRKLLATYSDPWSRTLLSLLKANGTFGGITKEAVKQVERKLRRPRTGVIGAWMFALLERA